MEKSYYIGIDVSKLSLDLSVCKTGKVVHYVKIMNTPAAIRKGFKQLLRLSGMESGTCCVIMEYTGIYTFHLINHLTETGIEFFVVPALEVKRSIGLTRGKNDKVDSQRLAHYGFEKYTSLKPYNPPRKIIAELSGLVSLRTRLMKSKQSLNTAMKESAGFMEKAVAKELNGLQSQSVKALEKDLKKVDSRIQELAHSDDQLSKMIKQITSVDGIGNVTALQVIITTNEFKNIREPKKFACYAGIAPFVHSSGTSVRGKTRVSHLANKTIKHLLHMASLSAIRMKGDMKTYYDRKVDEGKNKMSVLNAVRNKIVMRMFAVINQNKLYQKVLA